MAATRKLNEDARFSFPDRRHSSYSEVKPGVDILSPLDFLSTITPCSQKCIRCARSSWRETIFKLHSQYGHRRRRRRAQPIVLSSPGPGPANTSFTIISSSRVLWKYSTRRTGLSNGAWRVADNNIVIEVRTKSILIFLV
jgi:hypothetical protein